MMLKFEACIIPESSEQEAKFIEIVKDTARKIKQLESFHSLILEETTIIDIDT